MGSVVLKNGVQVLWAIERVVKLTNFFDFHDVTVKSDAVPAIFTFRDRVLEGVQSRGHGKRQTNEWYHLDCRGAVARNPQNDQVPH